MARAYVDEEQGSGSVRRKCSLRPPTPKRWKNRRSRRSPDLNPDIDEVDFPEDGSFKFKAFVPLRPVVTIGPLQRVSIWKSVT